MMLRSLTAQGHLVGVPVKPLLNFLQHGFMLPSRDAPLGAGRALSLQRAGLASARPIAAQRLAVLFAGVAIGQPLAGRTEIDVFVRDIDKVLLAEAAVRVEARGHRLRQRDSVTGLLAGHDFLALVIAAIGNYLDCLEPISVRACSAISESWWRSVPTLVTSCATMRWSSVSTALCTL